MSLSNMVNVFFSEDKERGDVVYTEPSSRTLKFPSLELINSAD